MNAHRRFALAAAAPALENLGTMVVLGVVAVLYTRSAIEGAIPTSLLLLLVADRVPGGVVAFQLATNFYFLPIALGATPVALSLVPRLSRMTAPSQAGVFRDTYVRGGAFR